MSGLLRRPGYVLRRQHEGVGRIYQQTFIDTYAKVALAKLYDRLSFERLQAYILDK
jgi:hypothetical protein